MQQVLDIKNGDLLKSSPRPAGYRDLAVIFDSLRKQRLPLTKPLSAAGISTFCHFVCRNALKLMIALFMSQNTGWRDCWQRDQKNCMKTKLRAKHRLRGRTILRARAMLRGRTELHKRSILRLKASPKKTTCNEMPTSEDRTTYKYKNTPEETNTRLVLREAVRRACENIASVSSSSPFFLRFDKIEPVDLTDEMCLVLLAAKLAEEDANTIASPDSDPRETVDPAVAADIKKGLWKPEYPDQLQMCATDPQKMSGKALSIWGLLSLERSRLWSDEVGRRARDLLNLELEQQEDVNVCEIDRPSNNESKKQRLSKIERTAMAVALHFEDPQRTAKSIAEEVGCSPSTLSKDLAFKRARETTREKVRKGHINRDNGVDGLVDPDYEDLD